MISRYTRPEMDRIWSLRNKFRPGVLFFLYIFGYSLSQVLVFFVRDNEVVFLGLKQAQLTALAVIIVAALVFVWFLKTRRGKDTTDESSTPPGGREPQPPPP